MDRDANTQGTEAIWGEAFDSSGVLPKKVNKSDRRVILEGL
jgi:hypothetical protein